MGRGRIPMEPIQSEKTRRTTFLKRRDGLMKKVKEFSILCDVNVCLIMYAEGLDEPETWPPEDSKVQRIIQKYCNTTSDRRPKNYDVHEYYKDKVKKIEAEISKVHKEELKILYPTWDDSYNNLGEEQLRSFISKLDAKLDACNQKINILRGNHDHRGKEKAGETVTVSRTGFETQVTRPYLASNPMNQLNGLMMQNMSQAQVFRPPPPRPPPPMNLMKANNDKNPLAFRDFCQSSQVPPSLLNFGQNGTVDWANQVGALSYDPTTGTNYDKNKLALFPFHYGQSSKAPPSLLNFGQNGRVDWANQVGALANYDPTTGTLINGGGAENNQNFSQCYCNGNMQRMQPYSICNLHTQYPAQIKSKEEAFLSDVPPGFQPKGFCGTNVVQAHMFSHMHGFGRK